MRDDQSDTIAFIVSCLTKAHATLLLLLLLLDNVRKRGVNFVRVLTCSTFHEYLKQNIIIMPQNKRKNKKKNKECPTTLSMYARVRMIVCKYGFVCLRVCVCLYV